MLIKDFDIDDLKKIASSIHDNTPILLWKSIEEEVAKAKELVAYTGFHDSNPVVSAGIHTIREKVGEVFLYGAIYSLGHHSLGRVFTKIRQVINSNFDNEKYHRVQAFALEDNTTHREFLEFFGFKEEGVLKKANYMGDNYVIYAIIK